MTGLSVAPGAGDRFYVLEEITQARELAEGRAAANRQKELSGGREHVTLETLFERLGQQDQVQTLNMILRADVRGLHRGHPQGTRQAPTPRSADQDPAGHRGRHHRGQRPPGRRLRRRDHRLQRGGRRGRPHPGRPARRADPPLRHHLPGDRRPPRRPGRHAQAGETRKRDGPRLDPEDLPHQPGGNRGRLPRAGRHHSARLARCA